jgi:signal transduction histidine kinase
MKAGGVSIPTGLPHEGLRETGITALGPMPWGTHLCQFYESRLDLIEALVPYFRAGLENNEFCLCVWSDVTVEEAKKAFRAAIPDFDRYLVNRSMEFLSHEEWYLRGGRFDLHRVIDEWNEKLTAALARGYSGIRVSGNTAWIQKEDWRAFREYEKELEAMLAGKPMIVLCTYPLAGSPAAQILDVAHIHKKAVAMRNGDWEIVEIPELKQARQKLKDLNEKLEQRVSERTADLEAAKEALEISEQNFRHLSRRLVEAQERERRHLARELHDQVGQALTATKINIEMLRSSVPPHIAERLTESAAALDHLLRQVRQISVDLRPPVLDDLGLVPALRSLFDQQTRIAGLKMHFAASDLPIMIDKETQTTCFRIAQETLTNILRHARARSVSCSLEVHDDLLSLKIADDGVGFDTGAVERCGMQAGCYGLLGIKERALLVGGDVRITSSPGHGTVIDVFLPIGSRSNK